MTWLGFFALQMCFIFMILGIGFWTSNKLICYLGLKETFWIDRVCIGSFVFIFLMAILGIAVLFFPWAMRQVFSGLVLACGFVLSAYVFFCKKLYLELIKSSRFEKIFLIGVVLMSGLGLAVSLLPVKLPSQLVDGPYVAKHDYLGVRIQYITGNLPTDNSLPHIISEYLLRDISFKKEHPVMPGQEVSNRPILAALVLVPIRAAFSLPPKLSDGLPKFNYVGTAWPDFSVLMQDDLGYLFSLSIGITLNSLLFFAVGAFAARAQTKSTLIAVSVVALMLTSPYFIFQTIFTWPKELAAFFILFSIVAYFKLKSPLLAGGFLAFGYLSHPYTIVFLIGFIVHAGYMYVIKGEWLGQCFSSQADGIAVSNPIKQGSKTWIKMRKNSLNNDFFQSIGKNIIINNLILFLIIFVVLLTPWFIWTNYLLHIPSDLVSQNFIQHGQRLVDFIWVRPVNFFKSILPVYLAQYPFKINDLIIGGAITIPGAVGILVFVFSILYLIENTFGKLKVFLFYIPSLLLILIFSNEAKPVLHGLQGPIALLLLVGVMQMQKTLNFTWMPIILGLQVMGNVLLLGRYFYHLV